MSISGVQAIGPSTWLDFMEDKAGDIILGAVSVAAFVHLLIPRFSPFLWFRGCSLYDGTQFTDKKAAETAEKVQKKIEEFRKKMGISTPVALMINPSSFHGGAQGLTGIPNITTPVIATGIESLQLLEKMGETEFDSLLCHELAHIKNCDTLKMLAFFATATAVSTLAAVIFASLSPALATVCAFGEIAIILTSFSLFSQHIEKQADLDACKTLGSAKGWISLCEQFQKAHREAREKSWLAQLIINADGDIRYDFVHPSLSERISYLREFEKTNTDKSSS